MKRRTRQLLSKGASLHKAGRWTEAAEIYRAVLRDDQRSPEARHLLGLTRLEAGRPEEARALVGAALEAAPGSAEMHHNYAGILAQLGDLAAAERHYRRAIALKPDYTEAYFNLAGTIRLTPDDPIQPALEDLLARGGWSAADRCFLHFAAGKLFDDIGAYDRAFAHYHQGNEAKQAPFDPSVPAEEFGAIAATFTEDLFAGRAGCGEPGARPIFIVGMPRSGTTLVEQSLARHPAVAAAGELPDIRAIANTLPQHAPGGRPYPGCVRDLPVAAFNGFARSYLKRVADLVGARARSTDKQPLNFKHLGLIALLFPRACIVHCRRSPLDTCLSCYFQNFKSGQEYAFDLGHLGFFYRRYQRLMDHWADVLPVPILHLDYEAMVARSEVTIRRLLEHCGLEWNAACLSPERAERAVATASRWQVRQPIYTTSVARWRRYEAHLEPLIEALEPFADIG